MGIRLLSFTFILMALGLSTITLADETGLVGHVYVSEVKQGMLIETDWAAAEELIRSLNGVSARKGLKKVSKKTSQILCVKNSKKNVEPGRIHVCQTIILPHGEPVAPPSLLKVGEDATKGLGSGWNKDDEDKPYLIMRNGPAAVLSRFLGEEYKTTSHVKCNFVRSRRLPRSGIRIPGGTPYPKCVVYFARN